MDDKKSTQKTGEAHPVGQVSNSAEENDQIQIVQNLKNKFRKVFELEEELKPMKGNPAILELKEDVKIVPIQGVPYVLVRTFKMVWYKNGWSQSLKTFYSYVQ